MDSEYEAFMHFVEIEKRKKIKIHYYNEIENLYEELIKKIVNYNEVMNTKVNLRYITVYSMVCFGYGKEIAYLQKKNLNNSIECIGRSLLECYSVFKKLCFYYKTDLSLFDDYIKYLIINDLDQDRRIYNDSKYNKIYKQNDDALRDIFENNKNQLILYFSDEYPLENKNLKPYYFYKIVKEIKDKYDEKFYEEKHISIGWALERNESLKEANNGQAYKESNLVYRWLCHPTHNSYSSIIERTMNNGYALLNNDTTNVLLTLELAYYCIKDIYREFFELLDE